MKRKFRKVDVPKKTYEEMSGVEDSGNLNVMTDEGEGLPYAPENFPLPGDKWRWRVGKRVAITGYHRDRFLYPPARLCQGKNSRNKYGFASKVSAERYIRREFPYMDVAAFFASFSWMVPAKRIHSESGAAERQTFCSVPHGEKEKLTCQACLVICAAPCGHLAHADCALHAYLAGTVGGSIGLDAEYFRRRCDSRTELISHVRGMMETCRLVDSRDEVEKVLNLSICILQGSQKDTARSLLSHIESVLNKIKSGNPLEEIWTQGSIPDVADYIDFDVGPNVVLDEPVCYNYQIQSLKIDDEINKVLQQLKKSQEIEYKITEGMLYARKNYLQNLYQQLEEESSELARQSLSTEFDDFLNAVLSRKEQIRRKMKKFKELKEVAKGFGRTSKNLLKQHFGIDIDP